MSYVMILDTLQLLSEADRLLNYAYGSDRDPRDLWVGYYKDWYDCYQRIKKDLEQEIPTLEEKSPIVLVDPQCADRNGKYDGRWNLPTIRDEHKE